MNPPADIASCSAAAVHLAEEARRLRTADASGSHPLVTETAGALDALADALVAYAAGLRDPRPSRPGRALPATALRSRLAELRTQLGS